MVFERVRLKFLENQLKRARAVSKKETEAAKKKIAVIEREESKKTKILKEKLKQQGIKDELQDKIRKAKQLTLTPFEKKILERRVKLQQQRVEKLDKGAKLVGRGLLKAGFAAARFLERITEEEKPRRKRSPTKKNKKKSPTKKKKSTKKKSSKKK